jgi:hypothetical protein
MLGLVRTENVQGQLFAPPDTLADARKERLMEAIDKINASAGSGSLRLGALGVHERAKYGVYTVQNRCSPRYTTRWSELPVVRA